VSPPEGYTRAVHQQVGREIKRTRDGRSGLSALSLVRRGGAWIAMGVVVAMLLGAVLLLFEGVTRVADLEFPRLPRLGASGDRGLWVYDASKGWFTAARASGRVFLGGPDEARVRTNSLGLRGGEIERRPATGRRRVLVFGDSFVFGVGVDEEHTFTARLQGLLGKDYEVVNMGVSGYSTDQEYILFQELGSRLGGTIVVLLMVDNDFVGNSEDFAYRAYYKPYFELRQGSLLVRNQPVPRRSRLQEVKLWLGQHSNAWNGFRDGLRRLTGSEGPFALRGSRVSATDPVELAAALVTAFRDAVSATGADFVMLNTGHRGEQTPLFQAVRPRLRHAGVVFLGLEETMAKAREERPQAAWDFGADTHWNVEAHRLAAEVAQAFLRKVGLVASPN
jgi:hypothetical protein